MWASVDPLAEKYPNISPYVYCFNNPIIFIDPDGRDPKPPAYYMNNRGFWIQGESSFGSYMGNVRPITDGYMELTRINGALYHQNTNAWVKGLWNDTFGTNFVEKKAYSVEEETMNDGIRMGAEFAVTGLASKAIGGLAGQLFKSAGNSLWKITALQRGFVYEEMLNLAGKFRVSNYPVIDAFYKGIATSIKTLDLGAKTYLKDNAVLNKLTGYVDDLASFEGTNFAGVDTRNAITKKVLEVGIPKGATSAQVNQINKAIEYASEKGIQMNVRVVK